MKTQLIPYQKVDLGRVYTKTKGGLLTSQVFSKDNIIMLLISFLLGRVTLFESLMPFGLAFYAASFKTTKSRIFSAAAVLFGMITGGAREELYFAFVFMFLFGVANSVFKSSSVKVGFKYSAIGFACVMVPKTVLAYFNGFLLYDLLSAVFYGFLVFSLIYIFGRSAGIIENIKNKPLMSNEEMISVVMVFAIALAALGDVKITGITLTNVVGILAVMLLSYKRGPALGSATGVVVGIIINITSPATPLILGAYAFCGLISGVFRNLGKAGSVLAFIAGNAVLALYAKESTEVLIYLKDMVVAAAVFMVIPQKVADKIIGTISGVSNISVDKASYSERIKELTVERLNKFSKAFEEISRTFSEISQTKATASKQDISSLFDRVADKVCKDCGLCMHCWDRNFYNTYQVMFKIVERLETKGWLEEADIPDYFLERCERIGEFVRQVNNIYELFKVDMVWKNRIGESRGLVSQQLEGMSKVISSLALEIGTEVKFKSELEDLLVAELDKVGIKVNDAVVFENKWDKYEVSIFHKGCGEKNTCTGIIEKTASAVLGRKMVRDRNECVNNEKTGICSLKLLEEEVLSVTTGVARLPKHGKDVSGDNYTFMGTGDGKYILALSDGMGSGQKAFNQSKVAISLLEQFMDTGFDKGTAIKLINSILVLKSDEDSFATIDLSAVDLYDGKVEFVKIGAVPTFIKKSNKVEVVRSFSLPVGILSNVETELVCKNVNSGDFIIMVTDGIIDSFKNEEGGEQELIEFIENIKSINPQGIAELILGEAYSKGGKKPVDDMTVIVAKVWKRIN